MSREIGRFDVAGSIALSLEAPTQTAHVRCQLRCPMPERNGLTHMDEPAAECPTAIKLTRSTSERMLDPRKARIAAAN